MQFTLTIELGNDAMQDGRDVMKALAQVAAKIAHNTMKLVDSGKIRDINGNTVGQWEVK